MDDIAQGSAERAVERPAGGEDQIVSECAGIDFRLVPAHDLGPRHHIGEDEAVIARDLDLIAGLEIAQETEMRIAMRGKNGCTALAGLGRLVEMAGPEGERLSAAAMERDDAAH